MTTGARFNLLGSLTGRATAGIARVWVNGPLCPGAVIKEKRQSQRRIRRLFAVLFAARPGDVP
ncbi:hypothetical protein [Methyloterricola oryzae]|uniref:hypothetical protein n=1 Tax=Methyloterricola oryzae TaxID=1495050 RepID=UPI001300DE98|nr:hypothetical protein [Methyloterricola oryzae]